MNTDVTIKVEGVERIVGVSLMDRDQIVVMAKGLVADMNYHVTWVNQKNGRIGNILPGEKFYPEDGMEFAVVKRKASQV